jgi:hypothetical protein
MSFGLVRILELGFTAVAANSIRPELRNRKRASGPPSRVMKKPGPQGPGFSWQTAKPASATFPRHYGILRVTVVVCVTPPPTPLTVIV